MTERLKPTDRTQALLQYALTVAMTKGWACMTRESVAAAAGVSPALVSLRLGTVPAMRRLVMRQAIKHRVLSVIAEGLAVKDAHALKAPEELREAAAKSIVK